MFTHRFQIHGIVLTFTERNIFDFGVTINPNYAVQEGMVKDSLALMKDGVLQWHTFEPEKGWFPVRPLSDEELICYDLIAKYGKYSRSGIRL